MSEVIRLVGALSWLLGLLLLLLFPPLGLLILLLALVLSILSVTRTRRERHEELIAAMKAPAPVSAPTSPTPAADLPPEARLGQLKKWLEDGLITQTEYDEKRQAVIDSI
jgi:hypothetical protein